MPINNTLGERLKYAASQSGGISKLSRELNISRGTIDNYVSGNTDPQVGTVIKISEITGTNLSWLLTGEGDTGILDIPGFLKSQIPGQQQQDEPHITDPEIVKVMAKSPKITPKIIEDAVRNLMEYLLEHEKTLEPVSISRATALLCEMGASEGTVTRETVERLMSFKG